MGELTGTLAEVLSPPLSGNYDSRLTAEVTSETQITVRVVGEGLDLFAMHMMLRPLMDRIGKVRFVCFDAFRHPDPNPYPHPHPNPNPYPHSHPNPNP